MSLSSCFKKPTVVSTHVVNMPNIALDRTRTGTFRKRAFSVRDDYDRVGDTVNVCMYMEELLIKAEAKDYDACKTLLEKGVDVNVKDEETRFTALHIAAKNRYLDILELLLDHKADCNAQDIKGQSPLHLAATKGHSICCYKLLKCSQLNVNIKNNDLETPLHYAAKQGHEVICTFILENENVDKNVQNKKLMTPLHLAAAEDHYGVIKILMDKSANVLLPDRYYYLPLHYAAQKGFQKSCETLLSDVSDAIRNKQLEKRLQDRRTPLMLAAKGGNHKCCAILTNRTINEVDNKGNTALYFATSEGYEKTVVQLLHMGAYPNTRNDETGGTPVLEATAKKKINCLKLLVDNGADMAVVDNMNKNVYHYAAEKNAVECLKYLLSLSLPRSLIDEKDKSNCTPLQIAFKQNNEECAYILLENNASPVDQYGIGMTPLHLAAEKGFKSICAMLLAKDEVQVNQENDKKETPLHLTARHGSKDLCQMLLHKGARISAINEQGKTPLHIASENGHANVVKFLAKRGASQLQEDDSGFTALHLAAFKGSLECCRVLASSAKTLCNDVYQNRNLPLDKAFEKKFDTIFKFLLMKLPYDESLKEKMLDHQEKQMLNLYEQEKEKLQNQRERMLCLHGYMHTALSQNRLTAAEAIIDSSWWQVGFIGRTGHFCQNFRLLIECHPRLALKMQDKCIHTESESKTTYNLRLFEDNYYTPGATSKIAKSPFEDEDGRVCKNARQFIQDSLEWKNMHPVSLIVSHARHQLLRHPVTNAWLLHKWRSYICVIYNALLFLKLLTILCLTFFMGYVDNWNHIEQCNFTKEKFCNISETLLQEPLSGGAVIIDTESPAGLLDSVTLFQFDKCNGAFPVKHQIYWVLFTTTLIALLLECNCIYRMKKEYLTTTNMMQILYIILTIVVLVPEGSCELRHRVLGVEQWQSGILALLVGWLQLINMINELPVFSVFLPITDSFLKSFFKVLTYITMLIFIFAFIFHLLLKDQAPFLTVPQAMVKTIVWMLGDLGYDDIFLNEDHELVYPIMVNILFVVFVTTIGGFIANMIITQPTQKLDDFRDKAIFYRAANRCRLILNFDVCFPFFHKYKTRGIFVDDKSNTYGANFLTKKILMLDTKEELEPVNPLQLQQEQNKHISTLMTLHREQREVIQDMKHQLDILTKSLLEK